MLCKDVWNLPAPWIVVGNDDSIGSSNATDLGNIIVDIR